MQQTVKSVPAQGARVLIRIAVSIRHDEGPGGYVVNYLGWLFHEGWTFLVKRASVVKILEGADETIAHVELDVQVVAITGKATALVNYQGYVLPVHVQHIVAVFQSCPDARRARREEGASHASPIPNSFRRAVDEGQLAGTVTEEMRV